MRSFLPALAFLAASILPVAANASPMNNVSGSAGGFSGSGTLVTTSNLDGSYTIVGITGTGVTGLISSGGFNSNDNLLFPSGTSVVDGSGFSFNDILGNTAFQVNVFSTGSGQYSVYFVDSDGYSATLPVDLTVSSGAPSGTASYYHPSNSTNSPPPTPPTQDFTFNFNSPSATPEPSSLVFLGTGLIAVAGFASRKRS